MYLDFQYNEDKTEGRLAKRNTWNTQTPTHSQPFIHLGQAVMVMSSGVGGERVGGGERSGVAVNSEGYEYWSLWMKSVGGRVEVVMVGGGGGGRETNIALKKNLNFFVHSKKKK